MKNCAIIPARGGSKGFPKKNIAKLSGYPLIAYSIIAAKQCGEIERTIVSTDSPEIAGIARQYGAEAPFLRPSKFSGDNSPNIDFLRHALDWFQNNEGWQPQFLVQLLPTTPLRTPQVLSNAIETFVNNQAATSMRSVHELAEPPQKIMGIRDGFLIGLFPDDPRPEYYNLPRQTFPPAYHPNGYVEIFKTDFIRSGAGLFGAKILALVTPYTVEIDRVDEFEYLEYLLEKKGHPILTYLKEYFPH